MRKLGYLALLSLFATGCGGKEPPMSAPAPRPVKVITLKEVNPVEALKLTGSVESWKEQEISFEVAGRVDFIVEPSTYLEGRWVETDKDGTKTVRAEGEKLAELDPQPYEIAVAQATASLQVALERLDTAKVELEQVLPATLRRAQAQLERARAEYIRTKAAVEKKALPELDLIRSTADRDSRQAEVDTALAAGEAKKADIKALAANVQTAEEDLRQAEFDLSRCTLWAPFSGEVSRVQVEAGGYARRGQTVAHLVMMNPIKVDLAVSPETAASMERGDVVRLYIPGQEEPGCGQVYEKATVADPETRTFRISVLTRNRRIEVPFARDDPRFKLPRVTDYIPLVPIIGLDSHAVESDRSLRRDDEGYYVWADPELNGRKSLPDGTVMTLRRYRVVPTGREISLQGLYIMRELSDIGDLPPRTNIPLFPPGEPKTDADEIKVVVAKPHWMLKPGQLIPVLLQEEAPRAGLYVPMNLLEPIDDSRAHLFVAREGKAKQVEVKMLGAVRQHVLIEGEGIEAGVEVITDYIHFLEDGEVVRVIRRGELGE